MSTIAVVGLAHIHAPNFLKRLKERPGVRVKALWDHDAERLARRAAETGFPAQASLEAIWSDGSIEAVVVCSETNRHEDLVLAAARAGKHLFVEKPLGMGAEDSRYMVETIREAGVLFQTGYFKRSDAISRFLKTQVDAGAFGTITRIRGSNCHQGALGGWFDTEWRWMADPSIAGCGAFGDLGTHALDLMLWYCGSVRTVTGHLDKGTGRYGDCDEFGEAMMVFENGVLGTLAAGWVDIANPVSLEICGTEGHATVVNNQLYFQCPKVPGADGKSPWTDLPASLPHAFELFLDAVDGEPGLPLVTVEEAAERSRVMEAIYEAAEGETWVTL